MKSIIEKLGDWGCDIKGAMERMADDEQFYIECLEEIAEDSYFEKLGQALKSHDVKAAFDASHTLKGVLANVGLTPMYYETVKIVEPMRVGSDVDLSGEYEELMHMRERLKKILSEG